jgi:HlyD family type I secretion membrane fusion protein|tara:strand:+ start:886 stop:2190 length:1305 start_codon:yes stop_codon:yes gene_type:complete
MSGLKTKWATRTPVLVGLVSLLILVVGLGGWSVTTKIEGAIVASGTVEVESFRQVVQHQDGGTVSELVIREGDLVEAGSVLMRFDDSAPRSERIIIQSQLDEFLARSARLKAERDTLTQMSFSTELKHRSSGNPELLDLMDGQLRLFAARRATLNEQFAQLKEQIAQLTNQISGLGLQLEAVHTQIELVTDELTSQEALLLKGLTQRSQVTGLKREHAQLEGRIGELEAASAQASGQIAETMIERLRLESLRREESITSLRDVSLQAAEMRQRLLAIDEILSRLELRAPTSGIVYGLQIHTIRAVVRPAEPVLYIVPSSGRLVVKVRIPTVHIDQVHQGQLATLNLSAFDQKITPVIMGVVTKVSPDAFTDEATGETYYQAEATPNPDALKELDHVTLVPGMPVEAFLRTAPRTPISYLLKPLTDYFTRAFREG